jgi:hypothetical protein
MAATQQTSSSCAPALKIRTAAENPPAPRGTACWEHGLTPIVLKRLRILIRPFNTPGGLAFDLYRYSHLYRSSPGVWGDVLNRYAIFQRLKRSENETEAAHGARQACWLRERRQWEKAHCWLAAAAGHDVRTLVPGSIALGVGVAAPEDIAGSRLETMLRISPTSRAIVLDLASDREAVIARIFELIDREREGGGLPAATKRGRKPGLSRHLPHEQDEFLRSMRDHHIVPLWDLQLAGVSTGKLATARTLYGDTTTQKRSLLGKLKRAQKLQEEALSWICRLSAAV